jgi:hypothetical protein
VCENLGHVCGLFLELHHHICSPGCCTAGLEEAVALPPAMLTPIPPASSLEGCVAAVMCRVHTWRWPRVTGPAAASRRRGCVQIDQV